jgi:hypothetical protein
MEDICSGSSYCLCRLSNIKGKSGSTLRSKSDTGQVNEAL